MRIHSVKERQELLAEYVLETGATVRAAARHFGISKSTVHKDLTGKLRITHPVLFEEVRRILEKNKAERHIRGGEATRRKYLGHSRYSGVCREGRGRFHLYLQARRRTVMIKTRVIRREVICPIASCVST